MGGDVDGGKGEVGLGWTAIKNCFEQLPCSVQNIFFRRTNLYFQMSINVNRFSMNMKSIGRLTSIYVGYAG